MALLDYDSDSSGPGRTSADPAPAPTVARSALPSADAAIAAAAAATPDILVTRTTRPAVDYSTAAPPLGSRASASGGDAESERERVLERVADAAGAKRMRAGVADAVVTSSSVQPLAETLADDAGAIARKRSNVPDSAGTSGAASDDRRERARADKVTVKDRTKHQRLAGQSGIGEDFRVWRSDEEMRLRQAFDS